MTQISLFAEGRCGWCGGQVEDNALEATVCQKCRDEAKRRAAGKEPIPHKGAEVVIFDSGITA